MGKKIKTNHFSLNPPCSLSLIQKILNLPCTPNSFPIHLFHCFKISCKRIQAAGIVRCKDQHYLFTPEGKCFFYLKRGGRITSAAAAMASVLSIKPLLIIGGNKIDAYEKVRGRKNCEKKLLKAIGESASRFKSQGYDIRIGIAGSFLDEADLSDWYGRAKEMFPGEELLYEPLTCSISSHVGPNAFGMGVSVKITL